MNVILLDIYIYDLCLNIHLKMKKRNVLCDTVEVAMLLKLVDHPDTPWKRQAPIF